MEIKPKISLRNLFRPKPENILRENHLRLDRNERTFLFDEKDFKNILNEISNYDLIAYPNLEPLYHAISKYHNINRSSLLLASGGDNAIKHIFETYLYEGDSILNANPNYAMYSVYSSMYGVEEIPMSYNTDLKLESNQIINQIKSNTKIIIISNPGHNGIKLNQTCIFDILNYTKNRGILILLDEAYIDFTNGSYINYVNKFQNLYILRTMSKGFGIASLRVSYIVSSKTNINNLTKVKPAYEISGVSAKIAQFLIENSSIKDKYIREILKNREFLIDFFKKSKISFLPTETNFIYFKTNLDSDILKLEFEKNNLYLKSAPKINPFSGFLRLTIGDEDQMKFFTKTLIKILKIEK